MSARLAVLSPRSRVAAEIRVCMCLLWGQGHCMARLAHGRTTHQSTAHYLRRGRRGIGLKYRMARVSRPDFTASCPELTFPCSCLLIMPLEPGTGWANYWCGGDEYTIQVYIGPSLSFYGFTMEAQNHVRKEELRGGREVDMLFPLTG